MRAESRDDRAAQLTPLQVIESYVTDVALKLPRKQRNDVAFELRALLGEELQGRAADSGRSADADMAVELVRAHGRPEEVAARYREPLTIIDPADGRTFARWTVIGLGLIWTLGLIGSFQRASTSESALLSILGQWWAGTVLPSFWWPGVLAVGFALSAWARRRWPESAQWQPRDEDRITGGRGSLVLAIIAILCGLYVLIDPSWLLDVVFGGRAAPAAYAALSYTESFKSGLGPLLLALDSLYVPLLIMVLIQGRWSRRLRRLESIGTVALCAVMIWTVAAGPVMQTPASDGVVKLCLLGIVVAILIQAALRLRNRVRPAPDGRVRLAG
jgi:hypothetical protein